MVPAAAEWLLLKQVLWRLGRRLARRRGGLGPQGGLGLPRL